MAKSKKTPEVNGMALMSRKRVERMRDGAREFRAHHAVLGAGWLRMVEGRFVFIADDGRELDFTNWQEILVGRARLLFNKRLKSTAEDYDYQSVLLRDGSAHEFRFEFTK